MILALGMVRGACAGALLSSLHSINTDILEIETTVLAAVRGKIVVDMEKPHNFAEPDN
jgi:hypothetical protein